MKKKLLKIFLILTIILSFCITYVSASDINLNLPEADTNQINDNTQINNEVDNQNIDNSDNISQNNVDNANDTYTDASITPTDSTQTLQPSSIASSSNGGLSVTNIINILLITVGIILILLAIAIIIRLK